MTSSPSKADLRRHFRQLRSRHLPPLQQWLDRGAPGLDHPLLQPRSPGAPGEGAVGLAWPLAGEPDLRGWLQASGLPLALPAVAEERLRYRPWRPGQSLVADAWGIPAPPATAGDLDPHQLALLLIPALAIDQRGVRLGYGGGWYDRLRADPAWRRRPALAVLPEACVVAELPRDPWDV
ncbi:MAG: 5-formyltetrahydrofolate cyclo-ligase, partial [Cyanobium sp.]